jgi:TatA/E family protein of Tat protein translocase
MVIALLVFGPQKLPEIGRQIGQAMRELKKMSGDMTKALDLEQHISMDTNYNYGSYSNYTDSSAYQEPMDQYGLSDSHAYEHDSGLALEPAPPSKTLEITGSVLDDDGTLVASNDHTESEVVPLDVVTDGSNDGGESAEMADVASESLAANVSADRSLEVDSPVIDAEESTAYVDSGDLQDSPSNAAEGRADSTSDEVA